MTKVGRPQKEIPVEEIIFTEEEKEYILMVKKGRHDPVFFGENLLGIKLHDRQKLWLWMTTKTGKESARVLYNKLILKPQISFDALWEKSEFKKNILVPSNRWGKTFVTSVKHIWYLFYKIGVSGTPQNIADERCGTLNLSPHSNQCQAGFEYILDILNSKAMFTDADGKSFRNECKIDDFVVGTNSQKREITFSNGTKYRAVPTGADQGSSLAGTKYLYASYDECAQSINLKAELPAKIMSRLIDYGGAVDLVSTPEVDRPSHQYFYHISKLGLKGQDGWFTLIGQIGDNVFLPQNEIKKTLDAIKSTDPNKYRQVKYGEFVTTGQKMFDNILVERLWDDFSRNRLYGADTQINFPVMGRKYLVSADWGFADTGDPTVFYIIDYTDVLNKDIPEIMRKYRIVHRESIKGGGPFEVLTRARILQREWNGARFIHDSSSMGGVIIKKMLQDMNMIDIIDFSASGNKADMLFLLIVIMSAGRVAEVGDDGKIIEKNPDFGRLRSFYIPELEEQMGNYQYNPARGVSDKKLEQDEIMSLGMGIWYLERKLFKNKVKSMSFNPLADSIGDVLPQSEAKKLNIHNRTVPEHRIF